jgi:CAAX prenyl protease-like protein
VPLSTIYVVSTPAFDPDVPHWRPALVLGAATGVAALLIIPYATAVTGAPLHTRGPPPAVVLALSAAQSAVLGFVLAWAGLGLGWRLGLDAPFLRAWIGRRARVQQSHWARAALVGVAAGVAIVALDALVFNRLQSPETVAAMSAAVQTHHAARWQGALASFYGGIAEEVQLRLFLMSALAWIIAKVTRSKAPAVFVAANVIAALAFGAGHLPLAAKVFGSLTPAIVLRTIVLNALAGVAFGELFRRYGLEHGMLAHFCADIVLHVVVGG